MLDGVYDKHHMMPTLYVWMGWKHENNAEH